MAALTTTTLVGAVSGSPPGAVSTVTLASASGIVVPPNVFPASVAPASLLYTDTELMRIVQPSPVQGTTLTFSVRRGAEGTICAPHASGATVYVGTVDQFYATDPIGQVPAVPSNTPWINVTAGRIWNVSGSNWLQSNVGINTLSTRVQATPANQSGTASTTNVMLGLAVAFTPKTTGNVTIVVSGDMANSILADGGTIQISYGTGAAPANGAAVTGTQVGPTINFIAAAAAAKSPFSVQAYVSGLTVNTAYWADLAFKAVTGGTFTLSDCGVTIIEG